MITASSSTQGLFDHRVYFPAFEELSGDACFVSEIESTVPFLRNMTRVKDIAGNPTTVYFYPDNDDRDFDFTELKPVAIACAFAARPSIISWTVKSAFASTTSRRSLVSQLSHGAPSNHFLHRICRCSDQGVARDMQADRGL
jgi:hypothetical protein